MVSADFASGHSLILRNSGLKQLIESPWDEDVAKDEGQHKQIHDPFQEGQPDAILEGEVVLFEFGCFLRIV